MNKSISPIIQVIKIFNFAPLPVKVKSFFVVILSLFAAVAESFSIGLLLPFLASLSSKKYPSLLDNNFEMLQNIDYSTLITIIFCITVLTSSVLRVWCYICVQYQTAQIGSSIGTKTFKNILAQELAYHSNNDSSDYITVLSNDINAFAVSCKSLLNIINSLLLTIFILIAFGSTNLTLTIVISAILGAMYLLTIKITRVPLKSASKRISGFYNTKINIMQEAFSQIRSLLLGSIKNEFVSRYNHADLSQRRKQALVATISTIPRYIVETIGVIAIAIFAYVSVKNVGDSTLIFATLAVFALGTQKLLPAIQNIFNSWANIAGSSSQNDRILNILNLKSNAAKQEKLNMTSNFMRIEFNNLCFGYEGKVNLLENVHFQLEGGELVGITGKSGSGKSTFIDIITGLRRASKGKILINNISADCSDDSYMISRNLLRTIFGYVPRESFLRNSSIRDIVFDFQEECDISRLETILDTCEIRDMLCGQGLSLDSCIGENGSRISAGQKQRIAIARALYKNPEILVLDEATSALDSGVEARLINNIRNFYPNLTIILVSHNYNSLELCDKVFMMSNKILAERPIKR